MTKPTLKQFRPGFSLMELMAVVTILGVIAVMAIPRSSGVRDDGLRAACHTNRAEIELQAILWRRAKGAWPAANLGIIGADANYFPEGVPSCPLDGSGYTIDSEGRVVGHTH